MALYFSGKGDEAMAASDGLLASADTAENPMTVCFALLAHGLAYHDTDPVAAYDALRRALTVARDSGNGQMESAAAAAMGIVAPTDRYPVEFLHYLIVAIRHYYDAGNTANLQNPLAILTCVLDSLGHLEEAATISGFAATAFTYASLPQLNTTIAHLRDVLGESTYESLARKGEVMTTSGMVAYAYDQIDQARAELKLSRNRRHTRVSELRLGVAHGEHQ